MGRRGPKPRKAEDIARAALALFVERGVKGTTTREIASRAQTTEGSLYRHYAGKADLARRVYLRCLSEFGRAIADALVGVAGPRERLCAYVRAYLRYAREHPLEHAFVSQMQYRPLAGVPDDILRPRHLLTDILSEGVASGVFRDANPQVTAPFIAGGLSRACGIANDLVAGADFESLGGELARGVERMLIVPPSNWRETTEERGLPRSG